MFSRRQFQYLKQWLVRRLFPNKSRIYDALRLTIIGIFFVFGAWGIVLSAFNLNVGHPILVGNCITQKQFIGLVAYYSAMPESICKVTWSWSSEVVTTFLKNMAPELAGIVIGFVTLDWLNESRQEEQLKQQLIRETASSDNGISRRAIFELQASGRNPPQETWLRDGSLRGAYLYGADLNGADLRYADLQRANLAQAKLKKAYLNVGDLKGADLSGSDLTETELHNADLTRATLKFCNFTEALFTNVTAVNADLSFANFEGAFLRGANLSGANLLAAQLKMANFDCANLSNAHLLNANLTGAILLGTNLTGCKLTEKQLSQVFIWDHAIMPDGTRLWDPYLNPKGPKLSDWIEDQKSSGGNNISSEEENIINDTDMRIESSNPLGLPISYQFLPPHIKLTNIEPNNQDKLITNKQMAILRKSVKTLSEITKLKSHETYGKIYQQFNVTSYKQLTQIQFEKVLIFLQDEMVSWLRFDQ